MYQKQLLIRFSNQDHNIAKFSFILYIMQGGVFGDKV